MNLRHKALPLALFLLLLLFSPASRAATPEPPPRPAHYVVDLAGVIDQTAEGRLNGFLRELEEKSGAQMIVLTIQSLDGEDIEGFSLRTAEQWQLGQKDRDNGLLMTIAVKDRRYRLEVGYGLEGVIPDSLAGSIGREHLVPHFRRGDYSQGISSATLSVIEQIADDAGVEIQGIYRSRQRAVNSGSGQQKKPTVIGTLFTVLFIIGLIILFIRNPRLFMYLLLFSMMGGRRGGWGGSGGFGGGGFGGGGGGGFGGGGASGGW